MIQIANICFNIVYAPSRIRTIKQMLGKWKSSGKARGNSTHAATVGTGEVKHNVCHPFYRINDSTRDLS